MTVMIIIILTYWERHMEQQRETMCFFAYGE